MKTLILLVALCASVPALAGELPLTNDLTLTPGVVDPATTVELACTPNYTKTIRHTSGSLKAKIYKEYGIDRKSQCPNGTCEIDHLISLELGGADVQENLWPQSYTTPVWNAHVKDKLENVLHRKVCDALKEQGSAPATDLMHKYQEEIRTDWRAAYTRYVSPNEPDATPTPDD